MEELDSSELGTLQYWDKRYETEIKNFASHGDPGDVWFGEDTVERILRWIERHEEIIPKTAKIVDVGCGNGLLLMELANEGFTNLYGVDYSLNAIELAKSVAEKHKVSVNYSTCDILQGLNNFYDVIHDKGTYDAISLSENASINRNKYIESVHKYLNTDGRFIITSCNWTQEELDNQFSKYFIRSDIIPTPQFKFGGKVGNVVTSCVYSKIIKPELN